MVCQGDQFFGNCSSIKVCGAYLSAGCSQHCSAASLQSFANSFPRKLIIAQILNFPIFSQKSISRKANFSEIFCQWCSLVSDPDTSRDLNCFLELYEPRLFIIILYSFTPFCCCLVKTNSQVLLGPCLGATLWII